MSGSSLQGYVGSSHDGQRGKQAEKEREKLFAASEATKAKLKSDTAAYRLKAESDKFSSSTNAPDVLLQQATVGLVTKEEFARRKAAIDAAVSDDPAASDHAQLAKEEKDKEKKKKKKAEPNASSLSFAFEDDEEGGAQPDTALPKKKKKKRADEAGVASTAGQSEGASSSTSAAASTTAATCPSVAAPAASSSSSSMMAAVKPMPAGYSCIRKASESAFEVQLEVVANTSLPKTRVVKLSSHAVVLDVKAREGDGESNTALCTFLRSVLGGPSVACELVRGDKSPLKTVRLSGSELKSADVVHHRLALACEFGKRS